MTQAPLHVDGLGPAIMLVGFLEGLFQRVDIGAWAASEVMRHATVPDALLALTPITGRDDAEIERALTKLAGPVPQAEIARLTIDVLIEMHRVGRLDRRELANRLDYFATCSADGLPTAIRSSALTLGDAFDLAESGVSGTIAEAEATIDAFVATFGRALR